jgi:glucosyl-3-phosphoglycerate synthase
MHPEASAWFGRRTSHWRDWPLKALCAAKGSTSISVVLPALNEERTIGSIVRAARRLADRTGLVDEVVVVDSGSIDRTAEIAAAAGATVYHRDAILPEHGSRPGKGEVLWKALAVTRGDLIVYVDSDLTDFAAHFVTGLLGPLLYDDTVQLVKAFYDRPLRAGSGGGLTDQVGGGRVTELMARPLLNAYLPHLAGVVQPLAGEYAARRAVLESLPFVAGYGVETGLLLDTVAAHGLDSLAQVDLGARTHGHQDTPALGRMAATILHTVASRVAPDQPMWTNFTQFHRCGRSIKPTEAQVIGADRPPMLSIPEYAARVPA